MRKVLLLICCLFFVTGCKDSSFVLNNDYYNNGDIVLIDDHSFNKLVDDKDSFLVFIYDPSCVTSEDFADVIDEFILKCDITVYKLSFKDMKNTVLSDVVKYFPSLVLYEKGEVVDFLDATSDEDTDCFKDVEKLENWIFNYVKKAS